MLPQTETPSVTRRRAILTDRERELLRDEDAGDQRYVAVSRVRTKIQEELAEDVSILQEHHTGLHEELRDVVCEEDVQEAAESTDKSPRDTRDAPGGGHVDEMRDAIKEAGQKDREEAREVAERFEESDSVPDLPAESEISDDVWSVVNEASAGWDDEEERLETRRNAAATALQYALAHEVYLGKSSDVVKAIRERYPVEGQNAETWWRKNVRDVLKKVGTYSRGQHGYAVEDLEVDHE